MDASPLEHVIDLHFTEKRAHYPVSSTRSRQMHTSDVLGCGAARGMRNTRARGLLAVADLWRASDAAAELSDFDECIPHFYCKKSESGTRKCMHFAHGVEPIGTRARPCDTNPHW